MAQGQGWRFRSGAGKEVVPVIPTACYADPVLSGCVKFILAYAVFFVLGVGIVLGAIIVLGKCVGPPTPEQQLLN
ncbi:MAG: hypothetical protein ACLGHC_06880 [Alphaproteobacteria bacterium]